MDAPILNFQTKLFNISLENFEASYADLLTTSRSNSKITEVTSHRLSAGYVDIKASCAMLDELIQEYLRHMILLIDAKSNPIIRTQLLIEGLRKDLKLLIVLKSFFFFCRNYHDVIATLLREGFSNAAESAPRKASMSSDVLKRTGSALFKNLTNRYPEYINAFTQLRERRNRIKEGVTMSCATCIFDSKTSIKFEVHKYQNAIGKPYKLADSISPDELTLCIDVITELLVTTKTLLSAS